MRRPFALAGGLVLSIGLAGIAAASAGADGGGPVTVEIPIRYSHYERNEVTVRVGVPVTFVLRNADPIDHEWIVGDDAVQQRHRSGTETHHDSRPTEISIPALSTRETTITFAAPVAWRYICHLPGHEAYGMVGTLVVR